MPTIGPNIEYHKRVALTEITEAVATFRRQVATDAPFQSEAYKLKRAEAEAYLSDTSQPIASFPMLDDISEARAMPATDLANLWLTTNSQWEPVLKKSEIAREKGKIEVASANTVAEIDAAVARLHADIQDIIT